MALTPSTMLALGSKAPGFTPARHRWQDRSRLDGLSAAVPRLVDIHL